MAIQRLFDNISINWEALALPARSPDSHRRPGSGPDSSPSFSKILRSDLDSVPSLEALYRQAVARGFIADSEANFLGFFATASYCVRVGEDPPALFAHLIRSGELPATLADEDWAIGAIKEARKNERADRPWLVSGRLR